MRACVYVGVLVDSCVCVIGGVGVGGSGSDDGDHNVPAAQSQRTRAARPDGTQRSAITTSDGKELKINSQKQNSYQ